MLMKPETAIWRKLVWDPGRWKTTRRETPATQAYPSSPVSSLEPLDVWVRPSRSSSSIQASPEQKKHPPDPQKHEPINKVWGWFVMQQTLNDTAGKSGNPVRTGKLRWGKRSTLPYVSLHQGPSGGVGKHSAAVWGVKGVCLGKTLGILEWTQGDTGPCYLSLALFHILKGELSSPRVRDAIMQLPWEGKERSRVRELEQDGKTREDWFFSDLHPFLDLD